MSENLQRGKSWNILLGRLLYLAKLYHQSPSFVSCQWCQTFTGCYKSVKWENGCIKQKVKELLWLYSNCCAPAGFSLITDCKHQPLREWYCLIHAPLKRTVLSFRYPTQHTSVEPHAPHRSQTGIFQAVWNQNNISWKGFQESSSTAFCSEKLALSYEC